MTDRSNQSDFAGSGKPFKNVICKAGQGPGRMEDHGSKEVLRLCILFGLRGLTDGVKNCAI